MGLTAVVTPSSIVNPETGISVNAWDSVSLTSASDNHAGFGTNAFSWGFSDIAGLIISGTMNFVYSTDIGMSLTPIVSYDGGTTWNFLNGLANGTNVVVSLDLTGIAGKSLSLLKVAFSNDPNGSGPALNSYVSNFQLTLQLQAVTQFHTVNEIALDLMEEYGDRANTAKMVRIVERWIGEIYKKIINYCNWSFARTNDAFETIPNVSSYLIYSATRHITSLRYADGSGMIHQKNRDAIVRSGFNMASTGKPIWWYPEGMVNGAIQIFLVPTPDTIYDIVSFGAPLPIHLESTDEIPLPSAFEPVLKDGVRYYYSGRRGHPEDAAMHFNNFRDQLRELGNTWKINPGSDEGFEEVDIGSGSSPTSQFGPNFPVGDSF